jgi:integrase/recombinase XerC
MINSFLNYIQYEKRYGTNTLNAYQNDLKQFESFLLEVYEILKPEEATFPIIRSWVVSLTEQTLEARSINRKIATLKSFYKFLLKKDIIQKNPVVHIKPLKVSSPTPAFVEEDKLLKLLDGIAFEDNFFDLRSQLILEVLYGTGIRLNELIQLQWKDIDFYQRAIKIVGKGNKERWIPLHQQLIHLIKKYELVKNQYFAEKLNHTFLIVGDNGGKSYPTLIYKTVTKYLSLITTSDKKSPHILRHTFATHLLNKGADLNAIKDLLGHANLSATQIYTHNTLDKLREVFEQAHPKA